MKFNREKFSANLLILRRRKRFTQQELADAAGLNVKSICMYETDGAAPKTDILCRLADALGTTPNVLCGWEECWTPSDGGGADGEQ